MPAPSDFELQLIKRCAKGDENAFKELFRLYNGKLLYYVRRLVPDYDSAEDVVQEVWLAAYRGIPGLRNPGVFKVWLYRIARNQASQHFRSRRLVQISDEELELAPQTEEEPALSAEDMALIHQSLQKLKPKHREVLTLKYMEELSYEEIAEVVGVEIGTIRSRIFYAKKALCEVIKESQND